MSFDEYFVKKNKEEGWSFGEKNGEDEKLIKNFPTKDEAEKFGRDMIDQEGGELSIEGDKEIMGRELLEKLIESGESLSIKAAEMNTSEEELYALSFSDDETVRFGVAGNPTTSTEVVKRLLEENDSSMVVNAAKSNLKRRGE